MFMPIVPTNSKHFFLLWHAYNAGKKHKILYYPVYKQKSLWHQLCPMGLYLANVVMTCKILCSQLWPFVSTSQQLVSDLLTVILFHTQSYARQTSFTCGWGRFFSTARVFWREHYSILPNIKYLSVNLFWLYYKENQLQVYAQLDVNNKAEVLEYIW